MKAKKLCDKCTLPATRSGVIAGHYYPRLCMRHWGELIRAQMPSSGYATYNRNEDALDHQADMIQPRVGGKLNPEFAKVYPDKAKLMFSAAEIDQALRHE